MKKLFLLLTSFMLIAACSSDDDTGSNSNKLTTPVLLTPSSNSIVEVNEFYNSFQWSEVENANQYLFQISSTSDFSSLAVEETTLSNNIDVNIVDFEHESTYYWRVKAFGQGFEESDYSQVFSFNVVNVNKTCEFCSLTYNGTFDAVINGKSVSNRPIQIIFDPLDDNVLFRHQFILNFGSFNNWLMKSFFTTANLLNNVTLNYNNRIWYLDGTTVTLNGTATFTNNYSTITGEFTLTGGHTGTITFSATL